MNSYPDHIIMTDPASDETAPDGWEGFPVADFQVFFDPEVVDYGEIIAATEEYVNGSSVPFYTMLGREINDDDKAVPYADSSLDPGPSA